MPILLNDEQLRKLSRMRRARVMRSGKNTTPQSERQLRRELDGMYKRIIFPADEALLEMIRNDASLELMTQHIDWTLQQAQASYGLAADDIVWRWILAVQKETRAKIIAGLHNTLGVDMSAFYDQAEMKELMSVWSLEASRYIRTIPSEHLGKIAEAVRRNFTGQPFPEGRSLLQQIKAIGRFEKNSHAKLIARDQTKKVSSSLNQYRQTSIGISEYIWRNVRDQRVVGNPSGKYPTGSSAHHDHWIMEGLLCRWNDPTVYSKDGGRTWLKRTSDMPKAHPGEEILCRCSAEAVIDVKKIIEFAGGTA